MGQLAFHPVAVIAKFVEQCGCQAPETVSTHLMFFVAHAAQSVQHGRIGDGPGFGSDGNKNLPLPENSLSSSRIFKV